MDRPGLADRHAPVAAWVLLLGLAAAATCVSIALGAPAWRAFVLLGLAPAAEEVVFRIGLHEALLRRAVAPWLANAATAVAFAVAHVATRPWPAAAALLVPALAIGWMYQRTRQLAPCVALHVAMNAFWMGGELVG